MTEFDSPNREEQPFERPGNAHMRPATGTEPLAIVSLVTGICGIVLWFVPFLGFLSAVAGVVTGIIHLHQRRPAQGLAIAGLVTGGVGVIGSLLFWGFVIFVLVGVASSTGSSPVSHANIGLARI